MRRNSVGRPYSGHDLIDYMNGELGIGNEAAISEVDLIRSLSQQELADLDAQLFPLPSDEPQDWAALVRRERLQREGAIQIELCSAPRGFPVCTAYDQWPGADAYLQDARALMMSAPLTNFESRQPRAGIARRVAYSRAWGHILDHPELWQSLEISKDNLKLFLGKNLSGVMSISRVVADRAYREELSRVITTHLPGLVWQDKESIRRSLEEEKITDNNLVRAREAIGKIPYRAPISDFFNLPSNMSYTEAETARTEIVATLGQEFQELCGLMQEIDPRLLRIKANRTDALAYLPVHELRASINTNPSVPPADICKAFMRSPRTFKERLAQLQAQANTGFDTYVGMPEAKDLIFAEIPNLDTE